MKRSCISGKFFVPFTIIIAAIGTARCSDVASFYKDVERLYSHPSASKYEEKTWGGIHDAKTCHHQILDCCEGTAEKDKRFDAKPGKQCFAVTMGEYNVIRSRKGPKAIFELDQQNKAAAAFKEKGVNFSDSRLFICLPTQSYLMRSADGIIANVTVMPRAKGKSFKELLDDNIEKGYMKNVLRALGKTLGVFQQSFMNEASGELTTGKHGDLAVSNVFCDVKEKSDTPDIYWIDCTHIDLVGQRPLADACQLMYRIEKNARKSAEKLGLTSEKIDSIVEKFHKKFSKGYCKGLAKESVFKLHAMLSDPELCKKEAALLKERVRSEMDHEKLLGMFKARFEKHLRKK